MNKPIQRVGLFVCLLVVALLANATYIQVIHANELRSDSRNSRVLIDEYARQRGAITAGGDVIAAPTRPMADCVSAGPTRQTPPWRSRPSPATSPSSTAVPDSNWLRTPFNGNDDRLFGQRFMDMFAGRDRAAATC